jgi:transcriptional regulator of acetoin/glycerol metabolism
MGERAPLDAAPGLEGGTGALFDAVLGLDWKDARRSVLEQCERHYLRDLCERTRGNVSEAARIAGMDRTYLGGLMRRHGLR